MREGEGDLGIDFAHNGATIVRLRNGATVTHTLGVEIQKLVREAHETTIEHDTWARTPGRHRRGRRRPDPLPVGGEHTVPLPITPTDRHGRGYGPHRAT